MPREGPCYTCLTRAAPVSYSHINSIANIDHNTALSPNTRCLVLAKVQSSCCVRRNSHAKISELSCLSYDVVKLVRLVLGTQTSCAAVLWKQG